MSPMNQFLAASLWAAAANAFPVVERTVDGSGNYSTMAYSYQDVPVSASLEWTPCFDKFRCANLLVPLDYKEPSAGSTNVAFIRLDVANGTGKDLLFNPGGPGNSGISYFLGGLAEELALYSNGTINPVTFDPRGVNNSGIALTCFPGNPEGRDAYYSTVSTPNTPQETYYQAVAYGQFCTAANNGTDAKYGSTTAVVQDLMHYTELQAALTGDQKPEEAKIQYYGVSYGTMIGHTLAALYPDRIERLIVDANVNSETSYNGDQTNSVSNADDALYWFFDLCAEAGSNCRFASGNSSSGDEIKNRFDALMASLEEKPLLVTDPNGGGPSTITKTRVLTSIFSALYAPRNYFVAVAAGLSFVEQCNVIGWLEVEQYINPSSNDDSSNYTAIASSEVLSLVTVIDAAGRYIIDDAEEYAQVAEEISESSKYFGSGFASANPLLYAGFDIQPPESQYFEGFKNVTTSFPILFINGVADPITPIAGAIHMSQYFQGSRLLTWNGPGHGTTAVDNKCTIDYIAQYLIEGTLPEEGTVCEMSSKPLVDQESTLTKRNVRPFFSHLRR